MKLIFLLIAVSLLISPAISYAERPHVTEDLEATEFGKFELEIGGEFENMGGGEDKTFTNEYVLIAGIYDRTEMNVVVPCQLYNSENTHEGIGDVQFLIKSRLIDEGDMSPAVGLLFNVITPTGDDEKELGSGHTDYEAKLLVGKKFGKLVLNVNGGYSFIKEGVDKLTYSASAHYDLVESFHIVSEIVGEADHKAKNEDPLFIMGGFQAHFHERVIFDVGLRFGLTKDEPDYTLVTGITIALN